MRAAASLAVLSTMHYEGDVAAAGGDYRRRAVRRPRRHGRDRRSRTPTAPTYDDPRLGRVEPRGLSRLGRWPHRRRDHRRRRNRRAATCPGAITPGTWTVSIGKAKLDPARRSLRDRRDVPRQRDAAGAAEGVVRAGRAVAGAPLVQGRLPRPLDGERRRERRRSTRSTRSRSMRGLDFVEPQRSQHRRAARAARRRCSRCIRTCCSCAAPRSRRTPATATRSASTTTSIIGIGYAGPHDRTASLDDVAAQGGIFIVNHPMLDLGDACIGCAWKHVDDTPWDEVSGIEVITGNFDIGDPGVRAARARAVGLAARPGPPHRRDRRQRRSHRRHGRGPDRLGDRQPDHARARRQPQRGRDRRRRPPRPHDRPAARSRRSVRRDDARQPPRSATRSTASTTCRIAAHVTGGSGTFVQLWQRRREGRPAARSRATTSRRRSTTRADRRPRALPPRAHQRHQPDASWSPATST